MEQAIKKAIEGGWKPRGVRHENSERGIDNIKADFNYEPSFLLDPLFWQALGKSLGWASVQTAVHYKTEFMPEWKEKWHRFIDHLAAGKSADDFFKDLLSAK